MGGSSSINGMVYVRGQPLDYDTWSQLGNRGWSYESVLPYFQNQKIESSMRRGEENGEIVLLKGEKVELLDVVLDAAEQCGYPKNATITAANRGFGYFQVTRTVDAGLPQSFSCFSVKKT